MKLSILRMYVIHGFTISYTTDLWATYGEPMVNLWRVQGKLMGNSILAFDENRMVFWTVEVVIFLQAR